MCHVTDHRYHLHASLGRVCGSHLHGPLAAFRTQHTVRVGAVTGELSPEQVHSVVAVAGAWSSSWTAQAAPRAPERSGTLRVTVSRASVHASVGVLSAPMGKGGGAPRAGYDFAAASRPGHVTNTVCRGVFVVGYYGGHSFCTPVADLSARGDSASFGGDGGVAFEVPVAFAGRPLSIALYVRARDARIHVPYGLPHSTYANRCASRDRPCRYEVRDAPAPPPPPPPEAADDTDAAEYKPASSRDSRRRGRASTASGFEGKGLMPFLIGTATVATLGPEGSDARAEDESRHHRVRAEHAHSRMHVCICVCGRVRRARGSPGGRRRRSRPRRR